jgi:hypothetical protein
MSGATGQIPTVTKAIATTDGSSAQTLGMITADLANNSNGHVTIIGLISDIDTSAYTDGAQLYLSGTTAGTVTTTKPYAPTHLVYVGIVEYAHAIHGKIFVKVQNGYELEELHNVSAQSPTTGQTIVYNSSTSLWEKNTVSLTAGVNGTLPIANGGTGSTTAAGALTALGAYAASNPSGYTTNTGTVTSITAGTGLSGGTISTSGTIDLASGYGDTLNPYASKTANYVLAAPNGSLGVPTFRALVAADIPTLNQNTTGSAATVTTTINSGVVATTQTAGDNSTKVATTAYVNAVTGTSGITGFKNRIINGAMGIWQRGTSFTVSTTTVTYTADRFGIYQPSGTGTITRDTDAPTGFKYSLKVVGAGTDVIQRIESVNTTDLVGESVTVSVRFKQTVGAGSGSMTVALQHPNAADNFSALTAISSQTFTPTSSWATYTLTFANLPSGVANGMSIDIYPTSSASSATYFITGVQLEKGSTATSFDYRPYGTELALCQRYFEQSYEIGTVAGTATTAGRITTSGNAGSTTTGFIEGFIQFKVNKRTAATMAFWDMAGNSGKCTRLQTGVGTTDNQAITSSDPAMNGSGIYSTGTATANIIKVQYTASAEL